MSFLSGKTSSALSSRSCNGDVQDPSSDDEMFVNSRLGLEGYDRPQNLYLELEEAKLTERIKYSMSPLFSPLTPQHEQDAIIFSIIFCGKNFGELGLFEPDISILDWEGFKSYLYSSLNLENSESFIISYEDEEGDKIPIQSEIEYNEALRLAKDRSLNGEKFHLNINRVSTGFPRSLRSLVSSSLRRVNSVGGNRHSAQPPQKKSVTTSTSFIDLRNRNFELVDVKADNYTPDFCESPSSMTNWGRKIILPIRLVVDFDLEDYSMRRLYNCVGDSFAVMNYSVKPFDKVNYNKNCFSSPFPLPDNGEERREVSFQLDLTCLLSKEEPHEPPIWFQESMQKMKSNMMNDMSSKMSENFQDFLGNLHDFDVEEKLRRIVGFEQHEKTEYCCRGHSCSRQSSVEAKREEELARMKECQERHLNEIQSLQGLKAKIEDNQAQLFAFIQNSNEEIKKKLTTRDFAIDKYVPTEDQMFCIEERESVLNRIQGCSQRPTMSAAISASDNVRKVLNSSLSPLSAKFVDDVTYPDGATVSCGQKCTKTWRVLNDGNRPWGQDVRLVCMHSRDIAHGLIPTHLQSVCPTLHPGEQGLISARFTTPNSPGMYMSKWRFEVNGAAFGDMLWCSVEALPEDNKEVGGASGVLQTILRLLAKEKPHFASFPDCKEELDLVVNCLQKNDPNSFAAVETFLERKKQCEEEELSEDEGVATPETEEADSHHFRSQRVVAARLEEPRKEDLSEEEEESARDILEEEKETGMPEEEEYPERDESECEYCDSHSELHQSEEEEASDIMDYVSESNVKENEENLTEEEHKLENEIAKLEQESYREEEDEGTEEDDDLVTESESEMIEEEEARRLESTSRSWTDKKFTLRQENFNQNIQVKLDFEMIAKAPLPTALPSLQTSASTSAIHSLSQSQPGPLTFREQHFTTSGCSFLPPPKPPQVPESDEEFDGVFINEDGLKATQPSDRRSDISSKDDDDDSSSTSSFSECEDEDLPPASQRDSIKESVLAEETDDPSMQEDLPNLGSSNPALDVCETPNSLPTETCDSEDDRDANLNEESESQDLNDVIVDDEEAGHQSLSAPGNSSDQDTAYSSGQPSTAPLPSSDSGTTSSTSPTLLEVGPSTSDSVDPPLNSVTDQSEDSFPSK